jgi:peptidoglycan/LPS O-acetylase OafA/YrhL
VRPTTTETTGHLHEVDVVRLVTTVGVIAVHAMVFMPASDLAAGAALTSLHVTREVFLFLSTFVLAYRDRTSALRTGSFWRRRYPMVVAPYAVWTVMYLLADGSVTSPVALVIRYARDLANGGARYHLYFLAVTLQLYAVFPWLLQLIRRLRGHHRTILAASTTFQVAFTAALHYQLRLPGLFGAWLAHARIWLPSYQLFVVAGIVAALNFEEVSGWVRRQRRLVGGLVLGAGGYGVVSYLFDLRVLRMGPLTASAVFQPAVVAESMAFIAGLYALGLGVADRAGPRIRRHLETSSDLSFGIYLAHPLVLQGVLAMAGSTLLSSLPSGLALLVVLLAIAPGIYVVTAGVIALSRRSPVSLALAGRPASTRRRRSTSLGTVAHADSLAAGATIFPDPSIPRGIR